jgi:tetratricopeptide (TPR) repeat protein
MDACANLSSCEKCLAMIAHGADAVHGGNFAMADAAFRAAEVMAQTAPPEQARNLIPLAVFNLSLLRKQQGRAEESLRLREQATTQLDDNVEWMQLTLFQVLMASVLTELEEYRRAIPFREKVIELERESADPVSMADMLWRAGECYGRSGLRDHAAVYLRASANIFRSCAGDPRLPAVLVALGNSLRKTNATEAETCFREAAELHVARGQIQSATAAWANLGIVCSEQGRHAESLEHYEKVLQVREQSRGTPPARMGVLLNNMANCYRRMGKFPEAFRFVDRAIAILKPEGGAWLAAAYGTRGLIFRDAGENAEAVEWLREAGAEHERMPSPNLETISEDLENQIAALQRLGRLEEMESAQGNWLQCSGP